MSSGLTISSIAPDLQLPQSIKKNIHILRMLDEDREIYRNRITMIKKNSINSTTACALAAAEVIEYINILERRILGIGE